MSYLTKKTSEISNPWDNQELTEEEINAALNVVRKNKYEKMEIEEKKAQRQKLIDDCMKPWTPKEQGYEAEQRAYKFFGFSIDGQDGKPVFEIDDEIMRVVKILSHYFTDSPKFSEMGAGFSLDKGIMLMGNVGRGKSLLMHLFARNKKQCYNLISCRDIAAGYAKNGVEIVEMYSKSIPDGGDPRTFYQKQRGFCFDDLGTESEKKNYGNELNVMTDIILSRYDKKYEMPLFMTHITTNLSADEIEAMYGTRIRSRCREMFNVIKLNGNDRRK